MTLTSKYKNIRILSFGFFFVLLMPSVSFATTIHVPADYSTIQLAVNSAINGDTVLVSDSTSSYSGADFGGKAITVRSENGPKNCIVAGVFVFNSGEKSDSILMGFTIKDNTGSSGIECDNSSSPTISGCTISGNNYGIECKSSSCPMISDCDISDNNGYGIKCSSSSPTISDCDITDNGDISVTDSGGINVSGDNCSPTISYCNISNKASYGIRIHGSNDTSSPTISNCDISNSKYDGIYCSLAIPTISGCNISGNDGNGIYIDKQFTTSSPKIIGCTIKKNHHGIFCFSSSPEISDSSIDDNNGDGISCSSSSLTVSNCQISGNKGDGIYCPSSDTSRVTISDCDITNNDSSGICIAGYDFESPPTISGCTISGNDHGIYCSSSSPTISDCVISSNNGGGIYVAGTNSSPSPTISGCTISKNERGIYCSSSSPDIIKCIIKDNVTNNNGGGLIFSSCENPTITNSIISGNKSSKIGGGIFSTSSSLAITNCTISGNTSNAWGGVYMVNGSSKIFNTIVWGNTPDDSSIRTSAVVQNSDIASYPAGSAGNIDQDPLFIGNGDYQLVADSPCIDTGTSSGVPATDIDGTIRPQGFGYDMGAYEYIFIGPFGYVNQNLSAACNGNTPCYPTIQNAINESVTGSMIKIVGESYSESAGLNDDKELILSGNWDASFQNQTEVTILSNAPTVSQGLLILRSLTIRP